MIVLALCLLWVPFPHMLSPNWDVWVVDEQGNPVGGMNVRLIYQDYSLESVDHEEIRVADPRGHVRFDAKSTTSTVAAHIAGIIRSFSQTGFHAGFGRDAFVVVFGKGRREARYMSPWHGWSSNKESRIVTVPVT
jgi:hypothetical protein